MSDRSSARGGRPRRPSLPDVVADSLRQDIVSGRLAPGDRLATEHALSERFGVSRPAVREAISRLRHDGLVDSRPGAGAFVAAAGMARSFRIESIEDRAELAQIFELRIACETAAAALAAERRSEATLARIRAALDAMAAEIARSADASPSDAGFHLAIAEATGNRYFGDFMGFLDGRLRRSIEASRSELRSDGERARAVHAEHEGIYQAIAAGDGERARAAMLLHLKLAYEELGLDGPKRLSDKAARS